MSIKGCIFSFQDKIFFPEGCAIFPFAPPVRGGIWKALGIKMVQLSYLQEELKQQVKNHVKKYHLKDWK